MKRKMKPFIMALFVTLLCANLTYAEELKPSPDTTIQKNVESGQPPKEEQTIPQSATLNSSGANPTSQVQSSTVEVSNKTPQPFVNPVVVPEPKKRILKPANRKVDLRAIIFDPTVVSKAPEDADEMTKTEIAKYKIHEALHGEVSAASTKGLLEDTMKMTFEKGPIESIAPWIDYGSAFTDTWTGAKYTNTTYGINFQDVGFNGKFRTNDDPASGKKTVFRLMFNTGKAIDGNTYLQSFLADNYIMRYWTKDDQILLGNARTAVGIEGGESPFTIPFFARSQISRTYGNVRAVGIKAQGNHKLYDYSAGFFSSGRFFKDFFPGPEVVGLFSVKPLGLTDGRYGNLTMGGSLNAGNAEDHYCVTGAHLIYDYKRLKASFEYANANGSNGSTGFTAANSDGFYGTLAYRVTPRIQLVGRYDWFDPNKDKANDIRTEYTAGLNYYVKGQALKLMVNFVYYTVENGTYGCRVMSGAQIIL